MTHDLSANPLGTLPGAGGTRPLWMRFPRLYRTLPYVALAQLPTPLTEAPTLAAELGLRALILKRDDRCGVAYGGNKVRKLELLLADALHHKKRWVATYGGLGSHHCLATSVYALHFGLGSRLFHLHQPVTEHVRRNLRAMAATGAQMTPASSVDAGPTELAAWRDALSPDTYRIPLGGSSPRGAIGFVNAALELAEQTEPPDALVVALGSAGTLVGLQIGLAIAGWRSTRLVGVRVVDARVAAPERIQRLLESTHRELTDAGAEVSLEAVRAQPVEVLHTCFGQGYGEATDAGQEAAHRLQASTGVVLEQTYTAKAFAGLIEWAQGQGAGKGLLFWNTYNGRPIDRWVDARPIDTLEDSYRALIV